MVVDAAATIFAPIAAKSGIGDRHGSPEVVVDAAAEIGRVAADCAVAHCQCRAAIDAIVVDAPADTKVDRVAADCAAAECQARVIIVDSAAKIADDCSKAASRGFITHLKTAGVADEKIAELHTKYVQGTEKLASKIEDMRKGILEGLGKPV